MKRLPYDDPGRHPDLRSPARLLVWVGLQQKGTLALGIAFGIVWMLAQALLPYALGQAVEDGLVADDTGALVRWAAVLLGLGTIQAIAGILRHRAAVSNWLQASYRLIQVVSHHVARTGPAVRSRLTTGEVVATISNDAIRAGGAFDITARLAGAIASYFVVAAILLSASRTLGLVVLLGVPLL
ncbi:MAG TPA: ABC transporter transmembrane domain-containing protein, partial [Gaiellaceae bacterium]|nr:ABC transporter transmembrane domain-containing protein [Gaiellaceae bacterium]